MKQFSAGVMVGVLLSGTVALGGNLYDRQGNLRAPAGSQQSFDYFRQRGAFLDLQQLRRQADRQRAEHKSGKPCND